MEQVLNIFRDWPVIVQGAIGSGIFWLVLYIGPKIFEYISLKYSERSLKTRKRKLRYENAKCSMNLAEDLTQMHAYVSSLTYVALRHLVRGLIWLSLGLATMSFVSVFGVVGFLGALYHFFKAADAVSPRDRDKDAEHRQKEIEEELQSIEEKLNQ